MNTNTITERQAGLEHKELNLLNAFLKGHIFTVSGTEYRYAKKDQELYAESEDGSDEELVYSATQSGIFMKMVVTNSNDEEISFKWIHVTDSLSYIVSLIGEMTADEGSAVLANVVLTEMNDKER